MDDNNELKHIFSFEPNSFSAEVNISHINEHALRVLLGLPANQLKKKKLNRKTFKKALMAYRISRNAAEQVCINIGKEGGAMSYALASKLNGSHWGFGL